MGAGNASATIYNTNVNVNTFGGNKKQGITSRIGLDHWANVAVQTYSNGYGRNKLFCMNQLGGVGAGKSMFNGRFNKADGIHCDEDKLIYHRIEIDGYIRYYATNIDSNVNKSSVLLCFPGGGETIQEFAEFTGFGKIGSAVIIFQGQPSANKFTFQNAFPWIYKSHSQNDVLFVDTVLTKLFVNVPNIFLTGKSDGGGFTILYSRSSTYKSNIKAIALGSSAHFILNDPIITPAEENKVIPFRDISMFIIHGTNDTIMPYFGEKYANKLAISKKNVTIWEEIDPGTSNTFTVNFPNYFAYIKNNDTLDEVFEDTTTNYTCTVNAKNSIVLNTISILGQDHDWSGHKNSGPRSNEPENFYLDTTYLFLQFFKLEQGDYVPTIYTIPPQLKTYDNLDVL